MGEVFKVFLSLIVVAIVFKILLLLIWEKVRPHTPAKTSTAHNGGQPQLSAKIPTAHNGGQPQRIPYRHFLSRMYLAWTDKKGQVFGEYHRCLQAIPEKLPVLRSWVSYLPKTTRAETYSIKHSVKMIISEGLMVLCCPETIDELEKKVE